MVEAKRILLQGIGAGLTIFGVLAYEDFQQRQKHPIPEIVCHSTELPEPIPYLEVESITGFCQTQPDDPPLSKLRDLCFRGRTIIGIIRLEADDQQIGFVPVVDNTTC